MGVGNSISKTIGNKESSYYGSWDGCPSVWSTGYDRFFIAEYFHLIMGGNNFHTGGGAAASTFMFDNNGSYALSGQSGSASNVVSGWDRNFFNWKGNRTQRISALDQTGQEVISDISIISHPGTTFFILKDFVTEGDAVRIKMPHFDWQIDGNKKNQYLWIENHQVGKLGSSIFDINKGYNLCNNWTSGLYLQIQVGKDLTEGSNIYGGGTLGSPNSLSDWLFPIHAEGNWDFYYSLSDVSLSGPACQWNKPSIPKSIMFPNGNSLSNPFTGYSDGFGYIDSNFDGIIDFNNEPIQTFFQKWTAIPTPGNPPQPTIPKWGDNNDAFTNINNKISISSNPSSAPVYTLNSYSNGFGIESYENRTIRLNNLAITIIDDDYYNVGPGGKNSYLIKIEWDDKLIENDVRWCGNIVLENDELDQAQRSMQIELGQNKILTVDRGLSPTTVVEVGGLFTDPSYLHLLNGTTTTLNDGSEMEVINGSTLHLQDGGNLILHPNTHVVIDPTSFICIEDFANIVFQDNSTSTLEIYGNTYYSDLDLSGIILQNPSTGYYAFNTITTSENLGIPTTMSSTGLIRLQARKNIHLNVGTHLLPSNSTNNFVATINFPNNCQNIYNFRTVETTMSFLEYPEGPYYNSIDLPYQSPQVITSQKTSQQSVSIYPNPTNEYFIIENIGEENVTSLILYDIYGITVLEVKDCEFPCRIDCSSFQNGIYFAIMQINDQTISEKILVAK